MKYFCYKDKRVPLGKKTYIMGILNLTPDSFSDGGKYNDIDKALKRIKKMEADGIDFIDIGGESTRPGHEIISEAEELSRITPVLKKINKKDNVIISVDTSKAAVAQKALELGADVINDVWGLSRDAKMAETIADNNAGVVIMHNSINTIYSDIMDDIKVFFEESIERGYKKGIKEENIIIDPGIGFGKTYLQNVEVLRRLDELKTMGFPILIGTSRKSVIGYALDVSVENRVFGTAASVSIAIAKGVDIIRVHDIQEMKLTARMADTICREAKEGEEHYG